MLSETSFPRRSVIGAPPKQLGNWYLAYEGTVFLPDKVVDLFNAILSLNLNVRKLAVERFVKSKDFLSVEPKNEIYPSLLLHWSKKKYAADFAKSKDDEEICNKDYPKAP